MNGEPVVVVDGLRKRYGDLIAVDGISFEVHRGEIFGMVGPNGAGKTTTVECIEGLRRPDGGEVRLLGLDPLAQRLAVAERVGVQLQESALPPGCAWPRRWRCSAPSTTGTRTPASCWPAWGWRTRQRRPSPSSPAGKSSA